LRSTLSFRLICVAIVAAIACGAVGCGKSEGNAGAPRSEEVTPRPSAKGAPNFVIVMTDDQAIRSLRFMPAVRHLLGGRGMTFTKSFTTTPECCPARATFLTGQYSHNHGVLSSDPPEGGYAALEDRDNILPVWLQAAGYRTGHVGKYLNGYGVESRGSDPSEVPEGWDLWSAPVNGTEDRRYGYTLNIDGGLHDYGEDARAYQTDVFARQASAFVRRSAGKRPFFLNVAPTAPHSEGVIPATVPRDPRPAPRHLDSLEGTALPRTPSFKTPPGDSVPDAIVRRVERGEEQTSISMLEAGFLGRSESLLAVDEMVRRLVQDLRDTDELADTYFIFTSDNGFLLGEHGLRGKDVAYEEAVRVPLIVRGPGIDAGATNASLVANVDLAPTMLELAKASPERKLDGQSLVSALRGDDSPARKALLLELLDGREEFQAVRTKRWKLADYASGGSQLFDLDKDPYELKNLAGDPSVADTERELRQTLRELSDCAGASCR